MANLNQSTPRRRAVRVGTTWLSQALIITIVLGEMAAAGFQIKRQVGRLSVGELQLDARDGKLGLARVQSGKWSASAPTISDSKGRLIAIDPSGKTPGVHLVQEKGLHSNWAFEFTQRVEPEKASRKEGLSNANLLVGKRSFRFKMKVAKEGPYKDWYVGVEPLTPDSREMESEWRPLKLIQDSKSAAEFEFVEAEYEVGHK